MAIDDVDRWHEGWDAFRSRWERRRSLNRVIDVRLDELEDELAEGMERARNLETAIAERAKGGTPYLSTFDQRVQDRDGDELAVVQNRVKRAIEEIAILQSDQERRDSRFWRLLAVRLSLATAGIQALGVILDRG